MAVGFMGEIRNAHKSLVINNFEELGIVRRIIMQWVLWKQCVEWWTHLTQDKIRWQALMNIVEHVYYCDVTQKLDPRELKEEQEKGTSTQ